MSPAPDTEAVCALGRAAGLERVGVASAAPLERARRALEQRKGAGLADGMQFTYRNPARSTDPQATLPGATSIVVGALAYPAADRRPAAPRPAPSGGTAPAPRGRVAWYAVDDHYRRLRDALDVIADHLRGHGYRAVVSADQNNLVDREVAWRAGLGWFGKNANILLPDRGSWCVLGAVITDAPLAPADAVVPDGCGSCRRCLDGCPTGAIVAPGVVDARRCLAWLVQTDGPFPPEWREALGDRLYGCDDCQEVCPVNRRHPDDTPALEGSDVAGRSVDVLDLLAADDETLLARHGRWYIPRRDPTNLRRNALVILGNTGSADDPRVRACLEVHLRHDDPLLRAHAVWAARRLGLDQLARALVGDDPDDAVRAELLAPVEARV